MEIKEVKTCIRVGHIIISDVEYSGSSIVYHKKALELIYDSKFPTVLKSKHLSLIYIFTVNGVIHKIGQSSAKNGISGCMSFYLNSGQDDPGINRFAINIFIREEIRKGNEVEVYMAYMDLITVEVPGLFKNEIVEVPISAKGMEELFMKQYHSIENRFPTWNYQENGEKLPSKVAESFGKYKIERARGRGIKRARGRGIKRARGRGIKRARGRG
ncbi:MAG: hypothetical protein FJ347_09175 [Sphingomonadales bacterium]|nr:hypothetical protein [Sphingomonadales bacterium]